MVQSRLPAIGIRREKPENRGMRFSRFFAVALCLAAASCQHKTVVTEASADGDVSSIAAIPGGPSRRFIVRLGPTENAALVARSSMTPKAVVVDDPGPGAQWAKIFAEGSPFAEKASYRGRPDRVEVFILADQASLEDAAAGRALVGLEGRRLQGFLTGIGAGMNYFIFRTLPVDTLGKDPREVQKLLESSRRWRNGIVSKIIEANSTLKMVLVLGPQAEQEVRTMALGSLPAISLTGPGGYQRAFDEIRHVKAWGMGRRLMLTLQAAPIPADDLPYGFSTGTIAGPDRKPASRAPASAR